MKSFDYRGMFAYHLVLGTHDRTLRAEEDLGDVANYIFGNPLQAGLADDARRYALSGGEYFIPDGAEAPSLLHVETGS